MSAPMLARRRHIAGPVIVDLVAAVPIAGLSWRDRAPTVAGNASATTLVVSAFPTYKSSSGFACTPPHVTINGVAPSRATLVAVEVVC